MKLRNLGIRINTYSKQHMPNNAHRIPSVTSMI